MAVVAPVLVPVLVHVLTVVLAVVPVVAPGGAVVPLAGIYRPPVDAPVVDGFRPPACRWCPGNRGLHYATVPGSPVRASGAGMVSFAGTVAGTRYVVVAHPDGLRTTYGHLLTVEVVAGQPVAAGAVLGRAGAGLHFGVRRGAHYLDPALLLARRARLVPLGRRAEDRLGLPVGRARPVQHPVTSTRGPPAVARTGRRVAFVVNRGEGDTTSWRRSSPCGSCSRRGCTSATRPAAGTRR